MLKILYTSLLTSLLGANSITLNCSVPAQASLGFNESTLSSNNSRNNSIYFSSDLGSSLSVKKNIFIKSNTNQRLEVKFSTLSGDGELFDSKGNSIPMIYMAKNNEINLNLETWHTLPTSSKKVTTVPNWFYAKSKKNSSNIVAGTYSTLLNVTIRIRL